MHLTINGTSHAVDVEPDMPLLWVLRDILGLTGTKYGCGIAQCGACTVHVDGVAMRSCQLPAEFAEGAQITTIDTPNPAPTLLLVQQAWAAHQVAQCGYCQSGQIMQAVDLLQTTPNPTDAEINDAMSGNLCRCGTYPRIREAIRTAAAKLAGN